MKRSLIVDLVLVKLSIFHKSTMAAKPHGTAVKPESQMDFNDSNLA